MEEGGKKGSRGKKEGRGALYLQSPPPQPRGSDTAAAASAFQSHSHSHMKQRLSPQQKLPAAAVD